MNRWVGLLAVVPLVAVLPLVTASPAQAVRSCTILEVTGSWWSDGGSLLSARTLPSDAATVVGTLPTPVSAIAAAGSLTYGLTDGGRVETITVAGQEQDLGPVRGHGRVEHAVAGTVVGGIWYVLADDRLVRIDVDPTSGDYLRVVGSVDLWPWGLADAVDGFGVDPATGTFYGVAQQDPWHGEVVRIDPASGRVTSMGVQVPGGAGYGAVSFGPDGALYARQNDVAGQSVRYRVPLTGGQVTTLDSGPAVGSSSATGCLPAAPPPPPPPTTTTTAVPQPPPPPPPGHVPPPQRQPSPGGTTVPPPTVPPTTTTPTSPTTTTSPPRTTVANVPPPTTTYPDQPLPTLAATSAPNTTVRDAQRHWSLALLVLIILGAAGGRARFGRRSGRPQ